MHGIKKQESLGHGNVEIIIDLGKALGEKDVEGNTFEGVAVEINADNDTA